MTGNFKGRRTEVEEMGRFWESRVKERELEQRRQERETLRQTTTLEEVTRQLQETRQRWERGEVTNEELGEVTRRWRLMTEEVN
jgi:hypothetical protein